MRKDNSIVNKLINDFYYVFEIYKKRLSLIVWLLINCFLTSLLFGRISIMFFFANFLATIISAMFLSFVATSYIVELFLRKTNGMRRLATSKEKEKLYEFKARLNNEKLDIQLLIIDSMSINAFALSKRTVAVTRGLLEIMNDEEITACLLHELAHIKNYDASVYLIVSIASNTVVLVSYILTLLLSYLEQITNSAFVRFFRKFAEIPVRILLFIWEVIFCNRKIHDEYEADKFVCKNNYKEPLLLSLYKIYDLEINDKRTLLERFLYSHPVTAFRIEAVENFKFKRHYVPPPRR